MPEATNSGGLLGQLLVKLKADTREFDKNTEKATKQIDTLEGAAKKLAQGFDETTESSKALNVALVGISAAFTAIPIALVLKRFGALKTVSNNTASAFTTVSTRLNNVFSPALTIASTLLAKMATGIDKLGRRTRLVALAIPGMSRAVKAFGNVLGVTTLATQKFATATAAIAVSISNKLVKSVSSARTGIVTFGKAIGASGLITQVKNVTGFLVKLFEAFETTTFGALALSPAVRNIAIAIPLVHVAITGLEKLLGSLGFEMKALGQITGVVTAGMLAFATAINFAIIGTGQLIENIGQRFLFSAQRWLAVAAEAQSLQFGLSAALENFTRLTGDASLTLDGFTKRIFALSAATGISVFEMKSGIIQMLDLANVTGLTGEQIDRLVVRIADFATVTGEAFGETVFAVDQALRGFPRLLQSMGLRVDKEEARMTEFARSLNKSWEEMTRLEKATAFTATIMEQTYSFAGKAAEAATTNLNAALAKARGNIQLLQAELGKGVLLVFQPFFAILQKIANQVSDFPLGLAKTVGAFTAVASISAIVVGKLIQISGTIALFVLGMRAANFAIAKWGTNIAAFLTSAGRFATGNKKLVLSVTKMSDVFKAFSVISRSLVLQGLLLLSKGFLRLVATIGPALLLFEAFIGGLFSAVKASGGMRELQLAIDGVRESWGNWLAQLGQTDTIIGKIISKVGGLTGALNVVANAAGLVYTGLELLFLGIARLADTAVVKFIELRVAFAEWRLEIENSNSTFAKFFKRFTSSDDDGSGVARLEEDLRGMNSALVEARGRLDAWDKRLDASARGAMVQWDRVLLNTTESFNTFQKELANAGSVGEATDILLSQFGSRLDRELDLEKHHTDDVVEETKRKQEMRLRLQRRFGVISNADFEDFWLRRLQILQTQGQTASDEYTQALEELSKAEKENTDDLIKERRRLTQADLSTNQITALRQELESEVSLAETLASRYKDLGKKRQEAIVARGEVQQFGTLIEELRTEQEALASQVPGASVQLVTDLELQQLERQVDALTRLETLIEGDLTKEIASGGDREGALANLLTQIRDLRDSAKEQLGQSDALFRNLQLELNLEKQVLELQKSKVIATRKGDKESIARLDVGINRRRAQIKILQSIARIAGEIAAFEKLEAAAAKETAGTVDDLGIRQKENRLKQLEIAEKQADLEAKLAAARQESQFAQIRNIDNVVARLSTELELVEDLVKAKEGEAEKDRQYFDLIARRKTLTEQLRSIEINKAIELAEFSKNDAEVIRLQEKRNFEDRLSRANTLTDVLVASAIARRNVERASLDASLEREIRRAEVTQDFEKVARLELKKTQEERSRLGDLSEDEDRERRQRENELLNLQLDADFAQRRSEVVRSNEAVSLAERLNAQADFYEQVNMMGIDRVEAERALAQRMLQIWEEFHSARADMEEAMFNARYSRTQEEAERWLNTWRETLTSDRHLQEVHRDGLFDVWEQYRSTWEEAHQSWVLRGVNFMNGMFDILSNTLQSSIESILGNRNIEDIWRQLGDSLRSLVASFISSLITTYAKSLALSRIVASTTSSLAASIASAWAPAAALANIATLGGAAATGALTFGPALASMVAFANGLIAAQYSATTQSLGEAQAGLAALSNVPGAAKGTVVDGDQIMRVGEGGEQEAIIPKSRLEPLLRALGVVGNFKSNVTDLFGLEGKTPKLGELIERNSFATGSVVPVNPVVRIPAFSLPPSAPATPPAANQENGPRVVWNQYGSINNQGDVKAIANRISQMMEDVNR